MPEEVGALECLSERFASYYWEVPLYGAAEGAGCEKGGDEKRGRELHDVRVVVKKIVVSLRLKLV